MQKDILTQQRQDEHVTLGSASLNLLQGISSQSSIKYNGLGNILKIFLLRSCMMFTARQWGPVLHPVHGVANQQKLCH